MPENWMSLEPIKAVCLVPCTQKCQPVEEAHPIIRPLTAKWNRTLQIN